MKNEYIYYHVCECPQHPTEEGRVYCKTPILEQAQAIVKHGKERGRSFFIKGVKPDGEKVVIL